MSFERKKRILAEIGLFDGRTEDNAIRSLERLQGKIVKHRDDTKRYRYLMRGAGSIDVRDENGKLLRFFEGTSAEIEEAIDRHITEEEHEG